MVCVFIYLDFNGIVCEFVNVTIAFLNFYLYLSRSPLLFFNLVHVAYLEWFVRLCLDALSGVYIYLFRFQ